MNPQERFEQMCENEGIKINRNILEINEDLKESLCGILDIYQTEPKSIENICQFDVFRISAKLLEVLDVIEKKEIELQPRLSFNWRPWVLHILSSSEKGRNIYCTRAIGLV